MQILHIIDTLSAAGPTRSLIASVKYSQAGHRHRVATLRGRNHRLSLLRARRQGIEIHAAPAAEALRNLVTSADIVHLHYWLNPETERFLSSAWPPMRLLIWFKILGAHAPQLIGRALLERADHVMVTSPQSLDLPVFGELPPHLQGRVEVIPGLMDPDRLQSCVARAHAGFNITYIGTTHAAKMHPDFVAMSAAVRIPEARFIVCGQGQQEQLRRQPAELGVAQRFQLRGFVEDIAAVLEISDVFGYPLCQDTYATSEKSLQEAMWAGVVPVVFPHGGVAGLVQDGHNGLVVSSVAEYPQAIEYLYHHPDRRAEMSANARAYARETFKPGPIARRIDAVYEGLLRQPKTERILSPSCESAAARFAWMVLTAAPQFWDSLTADDAAKAFAADRLIAGSSALLAQGEGGIVHFRNAYPEDAALRCWSGLVLAARGCWERALTEFQGAAALKPADWRYRWYEAVAAWHVRGAGNAEYTTRAALQQAGWLDPGTAARMRLRRITDTADQAPPPLFPSTVIHG